MSLLSLKNSSLRALLLGTVFFCISSRPLSCAQQEDPSLWEELTCIDPPAGRIEDMHFSIDANNRRWLAILESQWLAFFSWEYVLKCEKQLGYTIKRKRLVPPPMALLGWEKGVGGRFLLLRKGNIEAIDSRQEQPEENDMSRSSVYLEPEIKEMVGAPIAAAWEPDDQQLALLTGIEKKHGSPYQLNLWLVPRYQGNAIKVDIFAKQDRQWLHPSWEKTPFRNRLCFFEKKLCYIKGNQVLQYQSSNNKKEVLYQLNEKDKGILTGFSLFKDKGDVGLYFTLYEQGGTSEKDLYTKETLYKKVPANLGKESKVMQQYIHAPPPFTRGIAKWLLPLDHPAEESASSAFCDKPVCYFSPTPDGSALLVRTADRKRSFLCIKKDPPVKFLPCKGIISWNLEADGRLILLFCSPSLHHLRETFWLASMDFSPQKQQLLKVYSELQLPRGPFLRKGNQLLMGHRQGDIAVISPEGKVSLPSPADQQVVTCLRQQRKELLKKSGDSSSWAVRPAVEKLAYPSPPVAKQKNGVIHIWLSGDTQIEPDEKVTIPDVARMGWVAPEIIGKPHLLVVTKGKQKSNAKGLGRASGTSKTVSLLHDLDIHPGPPLSQPAPLPDRLQAEDVVFSSEGQCVAVRHLRQGKDPVWRIFGIEAGEEGRPQLTPVALLSHKDFGGGSPHEFSLAHMASFRTGRDIVVALHTRSISHRMLEPYHLLFGRFPMRASQAQKEQPRFRQHPYPDDCSYLAILPSPLSLFKILLATKSHISFFWIITQERLAEIFISHCARRYYHGATFLPKELAKLLLSFLGEKPESLTVIVESPRLVQAPSADPLFLRRTGIEESVRELRGLEKQDDALASSLSPAFPIHVSAPPPVRSGRPIAFAFPST